ncbi:MAG: DNA recombination protein RmuC [Desulfosarcinaceae bacterium]
MEPFFQNYGFYLLAVAAGLLLGGLAVGLAVRARLRAVYLPRLEAASSAAAVMEEKLSSQVNAGEEMKQSLDRLAAQLQAHQDRVSELTAVKAALEVRAQGIPALEAEIKALKAAQAALQLDLRTTSAAHAQAAERNQYLDKLETAVTDREKNLADLREQAARYQSESVELKAVLEEERKQALEKIALLNEARERLKSEFENLAQKIFEEKSRRFADQNKNSMDQLIGPLRQQLGDFKKRVEDVYDKETRDRTSLQGEIQHLKELNQRISKEALNLTRALKGDSKARGNWGEVILERVLEASGLQKGREYDVQVSLKDEAGRRFQPDVIVRLPEGKDVVIDAKVSLKDYEAFYTAEEAVDREKSLKAHIEALRTHVRSLAAKRYEGLEGLRSLDFVLMFIPIEAAFLTAVEHDRDLFSEAFEKNIMVVSPSTLLVTLRTIQNIWRYEYQNRYALEIAKKAGGLYDKFVGFVEALEEIGRQLDRARDAFRTAHERLTSGRGNLVRRTQVLKALGVKAGKELPQHLIEASSDENEAFDDNDNNEDEPD